MRLVCTVNGAERTVDGVPPAESLLVVLRERLGLLGTKNACERGECGSCTVYLDDQTAYACLVPAGQVNGRSVGTVEGLRTTGGPQPGQLDPVQRAFLDAGAVQCGFCTPGFVITVHDLLRREPHPSDARIREALAGNLCRCTGYEAILAAVRLASARSDAGEARS